MTNLMRLMVVILLQELQFTINIRRHKETRNSYISTIYKHSVLGVYEIKMGKEQTLCLAAHTVICD